jgi:hypothetical protein
MGFNVNELSDEELGAVYRRRYNKLCDAHAAGLIEEHPRDRWNADGRMLRDAASGELEKNDQPTAADNPPYTPGTPRPPNPEPGKPAQDRAPRLPRTSADGRIDRSTPPLAAEDSDSIIIRGRPTF